MEQKTPLYDRHVACGGKPVPFAGYLLPVVFAIATALPVLAVAWILAFSVQQMGSFYGKMQKVQKWMNLIVGVVFIIIGIYYCWIMYL